MGILAGSDAVEVAEFFDEYLVIKVMGEAGPVDDDLLDDEDRAGSQSVGSAASIIGREIDDNGTIDDPTDDTITITRERTEWNGLIIRHIVVRPLRPTLSTEWDGVWSGDMTYRQNGTLEVFLGEFQTPHNIGTISVLWEKRADEIVLLEVSKSTERLDGWESL